MVKYKSNEEYEKDRLKIIARHSILKDMGIDIIDLLKQSKWIYDEQQDEYNRFRKFSLLKDVDTTTIPN